MRKYGIDLDDGTASQNRNPRTGTGTRRMTQRQIEKLMGSPEDGNSNVFTWRDQNRRKVCASV